MNQTYTFVLGNKRYTKVSKHDMNVLFTKEGKALYDEAK